MKVINQFLTDQSEIERRAILYRKSSKMRRRLINNISAKEFRKE